MTNEILVVLSDLHCGSTMGLIKDAQWQKQEGGYYLPSKAQKIIYNHFTEGIKQVAEQRKGKKLNVVVLGDATEGVHHDVSEVVTNLLEEQERIHIELMDTALKTMAFEKDKDKLYYVGGTRVHVGGIQSEERIARDLEAEAYIKPTVRFPEDEEGQDGRYLFPTLELDINSTRFFLTHSFFRVGSRTWTEDNGMRAQLKNIYWNSVENRTPPYDWYISGHVHRYYYDVFHRNGITINGVISPAYQLMTEYARGLFPVSFPTIGMLVFEIDTDGHVDFKPHIIKLGERSIGGRLHYE